MACPTPNDADAGLRATAPMADRWVLGEGRVLSLDRPQIMAIVNLTPDSFSDGGRFGSVDDAVDHALRMIDDGASVIDVGGESTRPGAQAVPAEEQIERIVPFITALRARTDVFITIDTTLAPVAARALDAGADAINDVAAGRDDEAMLPLTARRRCGLILMHRRIKPEADSYSHRYADPPRYDDVVDDVLTFLDERRRAAMSAGVGGDRILLDPGLGFGKSVEQNYALIARTGELLALGRPVLSAASRKSFIGAVTGVEPPYERLAGSLAVSVAHWLAGARVFRVHDVRAHREALAVAVAIHRG